MKNKRFENFLYSKFISFIIIFITSLALCHPQNIPFIMECVYHLSLLFSLIIILFYIFNGELSKICLSIVFYCIALCVSTILGDNGSFSLFFSKYYKIIAMAFYLDYGLKHHYKNIITPFYYSFSIMAIVNFYTILRYPEGLYSLNPNAVPRPNNKGYFWFLGHYNNHIQWHITTLMFMFLKSKIFHKNLNLYDLIVFALITYSIFWCSSSTSNIAYCVLLLYLLFKKYINKLKVCNSISYFIGYISMFLGFVIFRIQEIFSGFIVGILGKTITFTGRTNVWDAALSFIKKRPLLGYGVEDIDIIRANLGHRAFSHAHNTILDVLYKGGIISLIFHAMTLILSITELYKHRKHDISKLLSVLLCCYFIMMNFEIRQEDLEFYLVLVTCFNVSHIIKHINENKKVS